ncbi:MAG: molybdopterin dinucleotide binding domain-containing protein [Candidatus Helarchaeota archaeon]
MLDLILITGRTIDQGRSLEGGKLGDEAIISTGSAFLDSEDMKKLKILTGTLVKVKTEFGEIVVRARISPEQPHPGIVYIPMGIYANAIVDPETDSTGMPSYKGIKATVEKATGEKMLTPAEIIASYKA